MTLLAAPPPCRYKPGETVAGAEGRRRTIVACERKTNSTGPWWLVRWRREDGAIFESSEPELDRFRGLEVRT